jgi:hypothetical protein
MLAHGLTTDQLVALVCARLVTATAERVMRARAALKWLRLEEKPAGGRSAVSEASSPATIDWMAGAQRPPIQPNVGAESV